MENLSLPLYADLSLSYIHKALFLNVCILPPHSVDCNICQTIPLASKNMYLLPPYCRRRRYLTNNLVIQLKIFGISMTRLINDCNRLLLLA